MTTVHLVRHGQSDWNRDRLVQGASDAPVLTALGRAQARQAAERLAGRHVTAVLSSDLRRAADTAAAIAWRLGLDVRPDPRLREQSLGELEGLTQDDALRRADGHDWTDVDAAVPGGESLRTVYARLLPLGRELRAGRYGSEVVLVSHGDAIRVACRALPGRPVEQVGWPAPGNGSVTTLAVHCREPGEFW